MNIKYFLAALCAAAIFFSCSEEKPVVLFNGENLDGWKTVVADEPEGTEEDTFSVKEGVMHITGKPFGYIRTEKKYSDYLLHLEWRWAEEESVDGGVFNRLQDGLYHPGLQARDICRRVRPHNAQGRRVGDHHRHFEFCLDGLL